MKEDEIMDVNPVVEPVVDAPVDTTIPDTTLAPTDEVIPAPADGVACDGCDAPTDGVVDGTVGVASPIDEPIPNESVVTIGGFFGTLQECVTIIWQFHLKTRKHSVHVELNDFYKQALDDVDDIIEQYQGINGVVEEPYVNCIVGNGKTEVGYITELKTFIECNKHILGDHSEINSTIDTFLGHIDSIIYKLTNLTEKAVKSFEEFCYEDLNEECDCKKFGDCVDCDEEEAEEEEEEEEE